MKDLHISVLDQYLEDQALKNNKVVAGVETAAEVCEALNSLPDTAAVSILNATLYDLEGMRKGSESFILTELEKATQNYICGRYKNTDQPPALTQEEGEDSKSI